MRVRGWPGRLLGVGRRFVEGNVQADLDVPAGDADFLDEQPQELLFLDSVEFVDHAVDPFSEVVDAAVDLVPAGQGCALVGELVRLAWSWRWRAASAARRCRSASSISPAW